MQLKLPVQVFQRLAKQAVQFAGRGREVSPGLSLVHLQATDKGLLRLSAHDAVSGARVSAPAPDCEPGSVAIDGAQLDRVIAILPPREDLAIGELGPGRLRFKSGRMVMDIPSQPGEEFMPLPKPPRDGWFPVTSHQINDVIGGTLWAMCRDELRPALAGVHLTSECSEATDSHMMAHLRPGILPEGQDVVVPGDSWTRLRALVTDAQEAQAMCVEGNRVWFRGRSWACYSALLGGQFPNTQPLVFDIDGEGVHEPGGIQVYWFNVNRHEMLSVVKRIVGASVSQEEKRIGAAVTFHLRGEGDLHLVSHYPIEDVSNSIVVDERIDWIEGNVSVDSPDGFQWLRGIGIYGQFMAWALSSLKGDVIKVMWAHGDRLGGFPMQFQEPGRTALVMPRHI